MVYTRLPMYLMFTEFTPTVPKLYWDVYSQEERIKKLCCELTKLVAYSDAIAGQVNLTEEGLEQLQDDFEKFMESGFEDYYEAQLEAWMRENAEIVVKSMIRQVYFGLTLEGRFVAYIPESWNDIVFDTGSDYTLDTYGRLILRWDADSPYSVEQTPEVVRPNANSLFGQNQRNIMHTLYTAGD